MFSEFAAGWVATLVANALVACCLATAGWLVWRWLSFGDGGIYNHE